MHLFAYPQYTSDVTDFLADLRRQKPELAAQQRAGRALLWDKDINREIKREVEAGRVPQKPYVYQTQSDF
ncbi:MAG: hypothetical protein RL357_10 [Pseudomonadota bacterium]|jgi:hypothetical protein